LSSAGRLCGWVLALAALTPLLSAQGQRSVSQEAINQAVDRGVAWVLQQQRRDGSWGENDQSPGPSSHRDSRNDLTAFMAYTLVKCKVPEEHPSVQRALRYLEQSRPRTTYAIATQLQLLTALGDERWEGRAEALLEDLLALREEGHGTWGYPGHPSITTDLSNTQYAALALRCAAEAGHKVPHKLWGEVAERVLLHQEPPVAAEPGEGRERRPQKAGFAYLLPGSNSFGYTIPNASMTAAGLTVLRIAEEQLGGRYPGRTRRRAEEAIELGFHWLEDHFSVTENTGGPKAWIYYYLYGLQRLGALYGIEKIGDHDWYWEGAAELVKWQGGDGHWQEGAYQDWPRQPMPHANTGYALLFLVKAMAPVTSTSTSTSAVGRGLHAAESPAAEVWLRAAVRSETSVWISGFGDGVVEDLTARTDAGEGLRVLEVRYTVDGKPAASLAVDPDRPWKGERFARQLRLHRNGRFSVQAEVVVIDPDGSEVVLESEPLEVEVTGVLEPWMLEHAGVDARNLLREVDLTVTASSEQGKWCTASRAVDGYEASRWLCKAGDARPSLRVQLRRPVRAEGLYFTQADSHPAELGRHPRVTRIGYRLNGAKELTEVVLQEDDPLRPVEVTFAGRERVRELELVILDFEPGDELASEVGLAEVGLLGKR